MALTNRFLIFQTIKKSKTNSENNNFDRSLKLHKSEHVIIVNRKFFDQSAKNLGSTKDVQNLINSSSKIFGKTHIIGVTKKFSSLLGMLLAVYIIYRRKIFPKFITFSIPGPQILKLIISRILLPRSKILFRSHNAEFPHRMDYSKLEISERRKKIFKRRAYSGLFSDIIAGFLSYKILGISRHDNYYYWRKILINSEKLIYFPYFKNEVFSKGLSRNKKKIILSVGSIQPGIITKDQELNFYKHVNSLGSDAHQKYSFHQSKPVFLKNAPKTVNIISSNSFDDFFKKADVVVVLGKYGRGTKTKIVDAITNGIPVITTQELFDRLDIEFKNGVFVCDSPKEFSRVLDIAVQSKSKIKVNVPALLETLCLQQENTWKFIFETNTKSKVKELKKITLITVVFENIDQFKEQVDSFVEHNNLNKVLFEWVVVLNHKERSKIKLYKELQNLVRSYKNKKQLKFIILQNSKNVMTIDASGGFHHAQALHYGIAVTAKNFSDLYCITDPDLIFEKHFFKNKVFQYATKFRFFGTKWSPTQITHNTNFPSPHFLICKNISDLVRLDFSPHLGNYKYKKRKISQQLNFIQKLFGNSFVGKFLIAKIYEKYIGINQDTGYRNDHLYKIKKGSIFTFNIAPLSLNHAEMKFYKRISKYRNFSSKLYKRCIEINKTNKLFSNKKSSDFEYHYIDNKVVLSHHRNTNKFGINKKPKILIANMVPAFNNTLIGELGFYNYLTNFFDVKFGVCEGNSHACLNRKNRNLKKGVEWYDHPAACLRCKNAIEQKILSNVSHEDIINISPIKVRNNNINPLKMKLYKDINVAEHSHASTCRYFGFGRPHLFENFENIYSSYIKASCEYVDALEKVFREHKFKLIITNHGIYVPNGIVVDMAKKYKIPIITWNIGYRKNTFYFAQKDTYHKIFPKRENNIKSLTKAQEQIISNYVRDRKERSSDWMWYVNSVNEKLTTDNLDQISSGKKIIGVFPNVFWDAQSHFDDAIYDDMYEFIDHIHKISQLYKDNIFIIRPHPAELNGQSQASILTQDYFNSFNSKNFYVLNANSSISSYTLAENSEFCISYASKIIPELSVMGKTVIVAGEAFAKGKGFTLDAQSKEDLENLVYNCVKGHRFNSLEEKVKALTFLYNYYYDWTVEFDCFSHTNKSNIPMIELNYSTKRELLNDKGMNKLLKLVEESLSEKKSV